MAKVKNEAQEPSFTKEHILRMNRYVERRDLLSVLLDNDESYTHEEVAEIIEDYFKH